MQEQIAKLLIKVGGVILRPSRPFTWASGIKSPIYCDNRLLLSDPAVRDKVIRAFQRLIKKEKIVFDVIAGVATAGIPYAAILADRLKKPLVYVRASAKKHGRQNQVEGKFKRGSRIIVIEDLISTGGSSLAAVRALRKSGAKVSCCLAIFSYGFPRAKEVFKKARCEIHTLTNGDSLLKVARGKRIITEREEVVVRNFLMVRPVA